MINLPSTANPPPSRPCATPGSTIDAPRYPSGILVAVPKQASKSSEPAQSKGPPALSVWEYAGLMITYWCNARCAFCYVYSAPDRGGEMSVDQAVKMWRGLDQIAASVGKTMRIHLAGGEPFYDWVRLIAIVRAARDA